MPFVDIPTATLDGEAHVVQEGATHLTELGDTNTAGAAASLKWHRTCLPSARPPPLTVTSVPPLVGPSAGDTESGVLSLWYRNEASMFHTEIELPTPSPGTALSAAVEYVTSSEAVPGRKAGGDAHDIALSDT